MISKSLLIACLAFLTLTAGARARGQAPESEGAATTPGQAGLTPPAAGALPNPQPLFIKGVMISLNIALEIRLKDRTKLRGRVIRVGKGEFDLEVLTGDAIETRTVKVAEVKSAKYVDPGERRSDVYVGAGVASGAAVLTLIILVAVGAL